MELGKPMGSIEFDKMIDELNEQSHCEYVNMFNDTEELYKASIQLLPEGEVL